MPIHNRVCLDCKHEFETITFSSRDEDDICCEICKSRNLKKMPGYMGLYEVRGDNSSSTPSKKRHRKLPRD